MLLRVLELLGWRCPRCTELRARIRLLDPHGATTTTDWDGE